MLEQRQWAELNAFTNSFGTSPSSSQRLSGGGGGSGHQHQGVVGQNSFQQSQQQQQNHRQFGQSQYHQQQNQSQHYGFTQQSHSPRYDVGHSPISSSATNFTTNQVNPGIKHDFHVQSSEGMGMDWTASSIDYENSLQNDSFSLGHHNDLSISNGQQQFDDFTSVYSTDGANTFPARNVGRLIAQFENNKNPNHPLPPRPVPISDSTSTTPINIGQQHHSTHQDSHQHHQYQHQSSTSSYGGLFDSLSHQQGSFTSNSYASKPFASNRFTTPSDSNYGSFDAAQSPVTSPINASSPPSFGGFHNEAHMASPATDQTTDPFASIDFMTNQAATRALSQLTASPMVSTSSTSSTGQISGGTPGFSIWKPPAQHQQHDHQQHNMQPFRQLSDKENDHGFQHRQHQRNQSSLGTPFRDVVTPGNHFRPPVPSTPKPAINSTPRDPFILELTPGSKPKPKAPAKPPKPRAPKPNIQSFGIPIKEEPHSPHPSDVSLLPSLSVEHGSIARSTESATPRPQTSSRPSREQVPPEAWEGFKSIIRDLYLEQRKPLKDVMSIMAEKYSFTATPKMYKTRFSQWGFVKNNTEDEVKRLLSMKFQRDAKGKVSEFVRNGKIINLGTYLKRKGVTEYDLVDFELPADLPSHVRCRTPTPPPAPEYLKSPDLLRAQELLVVNSRKAFLQCRQVEVEMERHAGWSSVMVWGAPSSELLTDANFFFEAGDHAQGGQVLMNAFNQLEVDLKQLSPQGIIEVMLGMVQRDVGLMTALCKYVAAFSTTNYERQHPLRQIFTCLYQVQQKHGAPTLSELLLGSAPLVAEELEAIYGHHHPYVARTWADLGLTYGYKTPERLEKLVVELRISHQQLEQHQEAEAADLLSLRCTIAQLLFAIDADSEAAKEAANDLWKDMNKMKLVFKVRDSRPNVYCFHCPVRVDPWTKRCRRRYNSEVELLERLIGVKVHTYFEEDCIHTMQHEAESQDAWTAAIMDQQRMMSNRWGYI